MAGFDRRADGLVQPHAMPVIQGTARRRPRTFALLREVLNFALDEEARAAQFYRDLAARAATPRLGALLQGFAEEEEGHGARIRDMLVSGLPEPTSREVDGGFHIAEYLPAVPPTPTMSCRDALVVAMAAEKTAFGMYTTLSNMTPDEDVRAVLQDLAADEARHKLRFEVELDSLLFEGPRAP